MTPLDGRRSARGMWATTWTVVCAGLLSAVVTSQERPLPDRQAFFAAARANIERSRASARDYAYVERRTQLHTNPFGRIGTGGTQTFRVTPSPDRRWIERQIIEDNGTPVPNGEVVRNEVRRRTPRADRPSPYADALDVLQFSIDRRELIRGRPAIVVRFVPNPKGVARTREGRIAKAFQGEAWIDEETRQVTRVEAVAVDSLSYGFGLVARLAKGTQATMSRAEVLPGVWQPTSLRITGEGRALVFRRLRIDHAIEWSNYREVERIAEP